MPFQRPTLTDLRNAIAADIATALAGLLSSANTNILGQSLAGLTNGVYGYLDWIAKESVPFTCDGEFLEAWAALKGVTREPATAATGSAVFAATAGTIPAGTELTRQDGVTYTTNADASVSSGSITVAATCTTPGAAGNCANGTVLTLGTAIAGVQSGGAASTAFTGGADVETDDALRTRMLQTYAAPPQGGDFADYIEWAEQTPGVTRAWVTPNGMGAGTVVVYTMFDVTESGSGGFPQGTNGVATGETRDTAATGDQLAVANTIFTQQPVTALVYSVAPTAAPQNFTISGLSGASTATKAAIAAAISDVFVREAGPGGAYDINHVVQGTLDLSLINSAIAVITGTTPFVITSPNANITWGTGQIPTLGTITWT